MDLTKLTDAELIAELASIGAETKKVLAERDRLVAEQATLQSQIGEANAATEAAQTDASAIIAENTRLKDENAKLQKQHDFPAVLAAQIAAHGIRKTAVATDSLCAQPLTATEKAQNG